jgi:hypothetical protein
MAFTATVYLGVTPHHYRHRPCFYLNSYWKNSVAISCYWILFSLVGVLIPTCFKSLGQIAFDLD